VEPNVEVELLSGRDTNLHSHEFDRIPTFATRQGLDDVETVQLVTFAMSPYTVRSTDEVIVADTTGGAITVTLPAPRKGKRYSVSRIAGAANVTVGAASGNVNGGASVTISSSFVPLRVKAYSGNYISV
jgi:hypothetical protein